MQLDTAVQYALTESVTTHTVIVDLPGVSRRLLECICPLDHRHRTDMPAVGGNGTEVRPVSLYRLTATGNAKTLTGILSSFDTLRCDAEIKLLVSCDDEDFRVNRDFLRNLRTFYIPNPAVEHDVSSRF